MPHFHISGLHAIAIVLVVIAALGSLNLLAMSAPDNAIAQGWLALFK